ncbi:hypothetical protein MHTCC0001_02140 [Flavobacteriaceae bacterium MHTCC 0001]
MRKIAVLFLLLSLHSCFLFKENGINFQIKNSSNLSLKSIKFYTSEKLEIIEFDKIEPQGIVSGFLSMKNNKSDGCYIIEYIASDNSKKTVKSGYYTNGGALDRWVNYEIKTDTLLTKFSGTTY